MKGKSVTWLTTTYCTALGGQQTESLRRIMRLIIPKFCSLSYQSSLQWAVVFVAVAPCGEWGGRARSCRSGSLSRRFTDFLFVQHFDTCAWCWRPSTVNLASQFENKLNTAITMLKAVCTAAKPLNRAVAACVQIFLSTQHHRERLDVWRCGQYLCKYCCSTIPLANVVIDRSRRDAQKHWPDLWWNIIGDFTDTSMNKTPRETQALAARWPCLLSHQHVCRKPTHYMQLQIQSALLMHLE